MCMTIAVYTSGPKVNPLNSNTQKQWISSYKHSFPTGNLIQKAATCVLTLSVFYWINVSILLLLNSSEVAPGGGGALQRATWLPIATPPSLSDVKTGGERKMRASRRTGGDSGVKGGEEINVTLAWRLSALNTLRAVESFGRFELGKKERKVEKKKNTDSLPPFNLFRVHTSNLSISTDVDTQSELSSPVPPSSDTRYGPLMCDNIWER